MKIVLKLVSLKQLCTLDDINEETVTVYQLKEHVREVYGIPIQQQKLIENGRVLSNDHITIAQHLSSSPSSSDHSSFISKQPNNNINSNSNIINNNNINKTRVKMLQKKRRKIPASGLCITVMGQVPKEGELKELTITDIISFTIGFLTLQEVRLCQAVSSAWCKLAIEGSDQNPDRFCILDDGRTVYDMLLYKVAYTLEHPIVNTRAITSPDSIFTHRNIIDLNYTIKNGEIKIPAYVYTGVEYVFQRVQVNAKYSDSSSDTEEVLVCVHVPSGREQWRISFKDLKPIDILNKQRAHHDREVQRRMERRRRRGGMVAAPQNPPPNMDSDSDDDSSDDDEAVEDNNNGLQQQQRTASSRKGSEFHYDDKLMMVLYDRQSEQVFVQFDTFVAVLRASDGARLTTLDPDESMEFFSFGRDHEQQEESIMSIILAPMVILRSVILLSLSGRIVLYNKYSLKPFHVVRMAVDIETFVRNLELYDPDDPQVHHKQKMLVKLSKGGYGLLNDSNGSIEAYSHRSPIFVSNSNILTKNHTIYDTEDGEKVFSLLEFTDMGSFTIGHVFSLFEDPDVGQVEGFYTVSTASKEELSDQFALNPNDHSKHTAQHPFNPSAVKLVAIRREAYEVYEGKSVRKLVVKQKVVPVTVWSTIIWIPSDEGIAKRFCVHSADRIFIASYYPKDYSDLPSVPVRNLINGQYEEVDEESDVAMSDANNVQTKVVIYALDAKTGGQKWSSDFLISDSEKIKKFFVRSGALFLKVVDEQSEQQRQVVLSAHSGNICSIVQLA